MQRECEINAWQASSKNLGQHHQMIVVDHDYISRPVYVTDFVGKALNQEEVIRPSALRLEGLLRKWFAVKKWTEESINKPSLSGLISQFDAILEEIWQICEPDWHCF